MNSTLPTIELSLWQKRQATLLYHYSSMEYLKELQVQVEDLIVKADALVEQRAILDPYMVSERWGTRDTSANWSTYGFPALVAFRESTLWHIAQRDYETYGITGANQCGRMMQEFSMQWMTPDQEKEFQTQAEEVFIYAGKIDSVMRHNWDDLTFWLVWQRNKQFFPRLPKFRVHTKIEGETDKVPPRTGVYLPQEDTYGALQFAWTGGEGRSKELDNCQTFNDVGLDALHFVGRDGLWGDHDRLTKFAKQPIYNNLFERIDGRAQFVVGQESFTERPCKWYFVELIEGEFEDSDPESGMGISEVRTRPERKAGGDICEVAGWWWTPASGDNSRRYFKQGELMPTFENSQWGETFWQWSSEGPPPK